MGKQLGDIKYKMSWLLGSLLSFVLYFTGIAQVYLFIRKRLLKRYRSIVLTYHRIRDDDKDSHIAVSTDNFDKQMSYLKRCFNVVPLNALMKNKEKKLVTLRDNVAITFDDGYRDNFLNAYPILQKYQIPATVFLISKLVGKSEEMLNVEDITLMKNDGINFGSHTRNHRVLTEVDINTANEEIHDSKTDLEHLLKEKVDFFAYPRGKKAHFNEYIKSQVKNSGYKSAFTTENGQIDYRSDLFELNRIGVRNCPLFVFKVRVSGIFESQLIYAVRKVLKLT
jgi:peptidoglycan/xylan/chitin deacetylase (PgdA/CDA1 family)